VLDVLDGAELMIKLTLIDKVILRPVLDLIHMVQIKLKNTQNLASGLKIAGLQLEKLPLTTN